MIMCVCVPLRARTVLEMVHLDGRAGWPARELRALSEVLLRASFVCKGIPLCVCACSSTCVERCCGFSAVMPLQARVTLEIVHFDRRAVGAGAPEGFSAEALP